MTEAIVGEVVVEMATPEGWRQLVALCDGEPCGSLSSEPPGGGRRLFVFGWRDGIAGVWRSGFGFDLANETIRQILTSELVLLAELAAGPYELQLYRAGMSIGSYRFRLAT